MNGVYDKHGYPIEPYDVIKIYHFTARLRRKKHYMYKHARPVSPGWPLAPASCGIWCSHLEHTDGGFWLPPGIHHDVEIVQGSSKILPDTNGMHRIFLWEDRPRVKVTEESDDSVSSR